VFSLRVCLIKLSIATIIFGYTSLCHAECVQCIKLQGFQVTDLGVIFRVSSGGCTSKKDFTIIINESLNSVRIMKNSIDSCNSLKIQGIEILYTWEEIGLKRLKPFSLENEFSADFSSK
jgi:hypothetical protein